LLHPRVSAVSGADRSTFAVSGHTAKEMFGKL
jgi:hypothetical protein